MLIGLDSWKKHNNAFKERYLGLLVDLSAYSKNAWKTIVLNISGSLFPSIVLGLNWQKSTRVYSELTFSFFLALHGICSCVFFLLKLSVISCFGQAKNALKHNITVKMIRPILQSGLYQNFLIFSHHFWALNYFIKITKF